MKLFNAFLLLTVALSSDAQSFGNTRKLKSGKAPKGTKALKSSNGSKTHKAPKSCKGSKGMNFNRVSTFPICTQIDGSCNTDTRTMAEIVVAANNGMLLVYADSKQENIGFVDISDPTGPLADGVVQVDGEPTSVAVLGGLALAAVNTSEDYVNTSGVLVAIDIATRLIVKTWDLGGQPDAVTVSKDGKFVVVAIENQRDEDLGDGAPPQMPAGYVVVIDTAEDLDDWVLSVVQVTDLDGVRFPEDPEPEYVSINENNIAVVTLQENNAIVLIDLATKTVMNSFSAGSANLTMIDTEEDPESFIDQSSSLDNVLREPDGVAFLGNDYFVTADEGDLDGGSRGFTIFNTGDGSVAYTSGGFMDQLAASVGHYPDGRSGNKGVEPENVAVGTFEGVDYLFVNAERGGLNFVYDVTKPNAPKYKQVLPTEVGPEGVYAIPERNLFVVSSEVDDRRRGQIRSTISIYQYSCAPAQYPTLKSKTSKKGSKTAIPFAALSGLSNDPSDPKKLYTIEDSFFTSSRFFTIDTKYSPALLTSHPRIVDSNDVFASVEPYGEFSAQDLEGMINADKTVNIDPEGIAADGNGVFYIAHEGSGTVGDEDKPVKSLNMIFKVDSTGLIHQVITLPDEMNDKQVRYGLEGVSYVPDNGGCLVVCLQRAWGQDAGPLIMIYSLENDAWMGSAVYPLDDPESQDGGWVGLSDIAWVSEMCFYVLERDNKGNLDAAVKRIYSIDLGGYDADGYSIQKTLVKDLVADDVCGTVDGLTPEKIEGLAHNGKGWWIVNDNDGVDYNSGEIQLMNLGPL